MPVEFSLEPDMHSNILSFPLGVYSLLKRSKHEDGLSAQKQTLEFDEDGSHAVSIYNKRTSEC